MLPRFDTPISLPMFRPRATVAILVILAASSAVTTARGAQDRLGGVYHKGSGGYYLYAGLTWAKLVDTYNDLGGKGMHLIDIEPVERDGDCEFPLFAGAWLPGSGKQHLVSGYSRYGFLQYAKGMRKDGWELIDVESHVVCGTRQYMGVFVQGWTQQHVAAGLTFNAFVNEFNSRYTNGWHLVDFETYVENGVRRWDGVWNPGAKGQWFWVMYRKDFESYQETNDGAKQLIDMESWHDGESRVIAGLFYSSGSAVQVTGLPWNKFVSSWDELASKNLRLTDLEIYTDTTDRRWENYFGAALAGNAMGWSFGVFEDGVEAESGASGWARSPSEPVNPSLPMQPTTVMTVASITKWLTTIGVLTFGEHVLDMPIATYLSGYFSGFGNGFWEITVRDLLSQKTGMVEPNSSTWNNMGNTHMQRLQSWVSQDLVGTPGVGPASYYNQYFDLAALIIEALAGPGVSVEDYMNQKVFGPVGIPTRYCGPLNTTGNTLYYSALPDNFGMDFASPGDPLIGGSWYLSAVDTARVATALRDGLYMSSSLTDAMRDETFSWYPWGSHWGVHGVYEKNGGLVDGGGNGCGMVVMAFPDGVDVALLSNSWLAGTTPPFEDLILGAWLADEDW